MLKVNIQYPAMMPILSLESLSDDFVKSQWKRQHVSAYLGKLFGGFLATSI